MERKIVDVLVYKLFIISVSSAISERREKEYNEILPHGMKKDMKRGMIE